MLREMIRSMLLIGLLGVCCSCLRSESVSNFKREIKPGERDKSVPETWKLSKPYSYKNLTLYMVYGNNDNSREYICLQEAMKNEQVVVAETGNVNQLTIENVSDKYVFVNSGEIVKGGKQDRVLSMDIILSPKSKCAIESFCVESGRWRQRGNENVGKFSQSNAIISSRGLRMSAKSGGKNQSAVWSSVSQHQRKLAEKVSDYTGKENTDVINDNSSTSLQLTIESDDLRAMMKDYLKHLEGSLKEEPEAIGFIYAINGEINNAEVYSNKQLFKSLWEKLINAAVIEAASEFDKKKKDKKVSVEEINQLFKGALDGKVTVQKSNEKTEMLMYDSKDYLLFETRDLSNDGKWTHLNYILKGDEVINQPMQRIRNYRSNDININDNINIQQRR